MEKGRDGKTADIEMETGAEAEGEMKDSDIQP